MMKAMIARAADELADIFNPKPVGEPVNGHVHESVREPEADFEAMRRFIEETDFRKVFAD